MGEGGAWRRAGARHGCVGRGAHLPWLRASVSTESSSMLRCVSTGNPSLSNAPASSESSAELIATAHWAGQLSLGGGQGGPPRQASRVCKIVFRVCRDESWDLWQRRSNCGLTSKPPSPKGAR